MQTDSTELECVLENGKIDKRTVNHVTSLTKLSITCNHINYNKFNITATATAKSFIIIITLVH